MPSALTAPANHRPNCSRTGERLQNAQQWTDAQRKDFEESLTKEIESVWNNHPFFLESKNGKKYIPSVQISFVKTFTNKDHKYTLNIQKELEGTAIAFAKDDALFASTAAMKSNIYPFMPTEGAKPIKIAGSVLAHEFGHLIGLRHPGAYAADPREFIPVYTKGVVNTEAGAREAENSPASYEADVYSVMGRGSETRWWMFKPWADYLDGNQEGGAPWVVKADLKAPTYKTYYQHWETYCGNRLKKFPGASVALPDIVRFTQN